MGSDFTSLSLRGAILNNTNLSQASLLDADLMGVDLSNAALAQVDLIRANLVGSTLASAILSNANLSYANLNGAKLQKADLSATNLGGATFLRADLRDVSLAHAYAPEANFSRAVLTSSNLRNAVLSCVVFSETNLYGADLTNAEFFWTVLSNCDLSGVIGLDEIVHEGPSSLSTDTIRRSGTHLSDTFLLGCGLADWEIENAKLFNPALSNEEITDIQYKVHSLRIRQAIQIKPLFISYSHKDGAFVDCIEPHLNERGVRYWRDIHHATAGRLERQIGQAIHSHPVVLLVLSANSVESDWVQHEARLARKLEQETKSDVLCPIALDDAWKTCDWPERLREQVMEYNVLDFSQWQDAATFDRMFGRLIEGLGIFYK